jgi:hypothetical protein
MSKRGLGLLFIVGIILSIQLACASEDFQQHSLGISISSIDQLVNVTPPSNLSFLIPNQEYQSSIGVEWAVPDSSIQQINSSEVLVFVTITSNQPKYLYFKQGDAHLVSTSVLLVCRILNNQCSADSELRKDIPVSIMMDKLGESLDGGLDVKASLMPPAEFQQLSNQSDFMLSYVQNMTNGFNSLNISDSDKSSFAYTLGNTETKLKLLNLENASSEISELNRTIEDLRKKSDLLTQIMLMEDGLRGQSGLVDGEISLAAQITPMLADAKSDISSGDLDKAAIGVNLAKNKYDLLMAEIGNRESVIPFFRKNLLENSVLVIAALLLIISPFIKLRKYEKIGVIIFTAFLTVVGLLGFEKFFGEKVYLVFLGVEILIVGLLIYVLVRRKRANL